MFKKTRRDHRHIIFVHPIVRPLLVIGPPDEMAGASVRAQLPRQSDPGFGQELPARGAGRRIGADHAAVREDAYERVHHGLLPPPIAAAGQATLSRSRSP